MLEIWGYICDQMLYDDSNDSGDSVKNNWYNYVAGNGYANDGDDDDHRDDDDDDDHVVVDHDDGDDDIMTMTTKVMIT